MAKHQLALDIPDTLNESVFRVIDASIYSPDVPTECPKLEITLPGFTLPAVITDIEPLFSVNLDACQLGIQIHNCGIQFNTLPDGVYIVRYSLSPNDKLYVEYNHLRITCALNKINKILCCLDLKDCEPVEPTKSQIRELQDLWMMLKGAKSNVEYCHHPKKGMAMYKYIMGRLDKLSCACGCASAC